MQKSVSTSSLYSLTLLADSLLFPARDPIEYYVFSDFSLFGYMSVALPYVGHLIHTVVSLFNCDLRFCFLMWIIQ